MLASDPKVGARRSSCWQPEDCYASGPPAASAPLAGGGATGSVEGAGPTSNESEESRHPPHRVPKERWAPMKNPRVRAASLRRGRRGFPPPVRFTRRCSVSGYRVTLRRAHHGPAHRSASKLADGHRWSEPPRPARGTRRHRDQERETRHRLPSPLHRSGSVGRRCATRRGAPKGIASNPRALPPKGDRVQAKPHPKMRPRGSGASPASWRLPASGQTDIVSIQERSGFGPRTRTSRRPGGRRADARASGARRIRAAHPCFRVGSVAGHRSGPRRTEPKLDSSSASWRPCCARPDPPKRDRALTGVAGQAMESNVSMFTSKNISEEPFSR